MLRSYKSFFDFYSQFFYRFYLKGVMPCKNIIFYALKNLFGGMLKLKLSFSNQPLVQGILFLRKYPKQLAMNQTSKELINDHLQKKGLIKHEQLK